MFNTCAAPAHATVLVARRTAPSCSTPMATVNQRGRLQWSQARRWAVALMLTCVMPVQALDFGGLGKVGEAVSSGQRAYDSGKEAVETSQQIRNRASGTRPNASSLGSKDEGGPTRLVAALGSSGTSTSPNPNTVVALLDQGSYFVQRQNAYSAPARGQVLAIPRGDSSSVSIELPNEPAGTLFDLNTGRARSEGKGIKILALSLHGDLPWRGDRRALDSIEQHAMLKGSSVQLEWPLQASDILEPVGGKLLVWASDSGMSFPSGFGPDGKLFTKDDPMVPLQRGYTVVSLSRQGFSFDRSREVVMPLHDVQGDAAIDLSRLSRTEALRAFIGLISERYPYRDSRLLDWAQLSNELLAPNPQNPEPTELPIKPYVSIGKTLKDGQFRLQQPNNLTVLGGNSVVDWGMAPQIRMRGTVALPFPRVWWSDDGRALVSDVAANSPASNAGLRSGAEIVEVNGDSTAKYVERAAQTSFQSTDTARRLDALSFTPGTDTLTLRVRQEDKDQTLSLRPSGEALSSEPAGRPDSAISGFLLRSAKGQNYGYLAINSFADAGNKLAQWERSIASLNQARIPAVIIDLRGHRGSTHQLVTHFMASFFSYDKPLRPQAYMQRRLDPSAKVWRARGGLGLPPQLALFSQNEMRFAGKVMLLTNRSCMGPCELFAAWLQGADRAQLVSTEPTAGAVGQLVRINLPDGLTAHLPLVAELRANGESYVHGKGLVPNIKVAVDRDFISRLSSGGDPVLDAAVQWLDANQTPNAK